MNLDRLVQIQSIEQEWKARLAKVRSDGMVHRQYAITKPVFTANDAQAELKVSFAAANTAALILTDERVLILPNAR